MAAGIACDEADDRIKAVKDYLAGKPKLTKTLGDTRLSNHVDVVMMLTRRAFDLKGR
jgi:hypothetical protein